MFPQNSTGFGIPFNSIFGDLQSQNTYGNNTNGSSFQKYTLPEGLHVQQSNNIDVVTVDNNALCKKYSISTINQNEQGNRSIVFKQKT